MVHSKILKFGSFCYHIYLPNQLKFWSSRWSALWVRKNWGPFPFQIYCVLWLGLVLPLSFSFPLGRFFLQNLQTHHPINATTTKTTAAKIAKIILKEKIKFIIKIILLKDIFNKNLPKIIDNDSNDIS
jgi:hypothetical protein